MKTLSFGSARATSGRKAFGQLHARERAKEVSLPVCVIHGARPGPRFVILANQHGTELNGIESVRRFCASADPARLKGTICAVISCNPRAAMAGQPVWTEDDPGLESAYQSLYNMNHNWPGRTGGRIVERVTHEIWTQAIAGPAHRADFVLDLHAHQNATAVYADDPHLADFGVVAGVRNIVVTGYSDKVNMVNLACRRAGILCMTSELGGQETFCEESVLQGITAIENLLKFHGMLPGRLRLQEEAVILDPWRDARFGNRKAGTPSHMNYTARHKGLVVRKRGVYDMARKGEVLCHILDPFEGRVVEECRAPMNGAIYNYRVTGPRCVEGQTVFTIAAARRVRPMEHVRKLREKARRP